MKKIFQTLQATESLIMACLQFTKNYCRLQLYLSRENAYPNAKITCHIKLKFFRPTKLLENLLLVKIGYLEIN